MHCTLSTLVSMKSPESDIKGKCEKMDGSVWLCVCVMCLRQRQTAYAKIYNIVLTKLTQYDNTRAGWSKCRRQQNVVTSADSAVNVGDIPDLWYVFLIVLVFKRNKINICNNLQSLIFKSLLWLSESFPTYADCRFMLIAPFYATTAKKFKKFS